MNEGAKEGNWVAEFLTSFPASPRSFVTHSSYLVTERQNDYYSDHLAFPPALLLTQAAEVFELPASTFAAFPATLLHDRTRRILDFRDPRWPLYAAVAVMMATGRRRMRRRRQRRSDPRTDRPRPPLPDGPVTVRSRVVAVCVSARRRGRKSALYGAAGFTRLTQEILGVPTTILGRRGPSSASASTSAATQERRSDG
ncbi:hypothetical protein DFJ73DRAFT_198086 [Zopfochytrium polystomum]|nr:hypothetical protein DFJ73DRAFT_198086 [Zopfochytrium polystomum]